MATIAFATWTFRDAWPESPLAGIAPVQRVLVEGSFERVSTTEVENAVLPHLVGGFFTVDLEAIKAAAESLPWVAAAQVMREWPDSVRIVVIEERAEFRWGSTGLLNADAELFVTGVAGEEWELPVLAGPDGSEARVVDWYAALNAEFGRCAHRAASVRLDSRRALRVTLASGVEVRFGRDATLPRARRFCEVVARELASRFDRVAYVDMRYTNGFAVGWRQSGPAGTGG